MPAKFSEPLEKFGGKMPEQMIAELKDEMLRRGYPNFSALLRDICHDWLEKHHRSRASSSVSEK